MIILNVLAHKNHLCLPPRPANAFSPLYTKNHNIFKSEALLYHYFVPDEEHKESHMTSKNVKKRIKTNNNKSKIRKCLLPITGGVVMAKKRKGAEAKARAKPADSGHVSHTQSHATHSSKDNTKYYVVGALVVLAVILYVIFGGREAPAPAPEAPSAPAEEPDLQPSDVDVSKGYTVTRPSVVAGGEKQEGSFFGGVKCAKDAGQDGKDVLEYQLKNMADVPFTLRSVRVSEGKEINPLRVSINGHNLRKNVAEACGKDSIAPSELVTCKVEVDLRHFGPTGKKSENVLKAEGRIATGSASMVSVFKFFC